MMLCAGELVEFGGEADVEAAGDDAGTEKAVRFSVVAYTGGAMRLSGWGEPVVVDLEGLEKSDRPIAVLKNHDPDQVVGHAEVQVTQQRVYLRGVVSGAGDAAREVIESSRRGFPWRASLGASVRAMEYVHDGEEVKANGRTFRGPVSVARKSELGEVSFVPVAADSATSATVAARAPDNTGGGRP